MIGFLRIFLLSFLCVAPLAAQAPERTPERTPERAPVPGAVPRDMLPPAGKCRIWMEGVAPAQQPAPTDCQTALRQRPSNGIVVFGPAAEDPPMNSFARPRTARDTSARETRPQRARPANASASSPKDSATSRRRRPE